MTTTEATDFTKLNGSTHSAPIIDTTATQKASVSIDGPYWFKNAYELLVGEIKRHVVGNDELVRWTAMSILCGFFTVSEGWSGVGKTHVAKVGLKAAGLSEGFLSLNPRVLPDELTGGIFFDQSQSKYSIRLGPFNRFQGVILDELNRLLDESQSAILLAVSRGCVSIDGQTFLFDPASTILGTLNPLESEGTYPMIPALRDRIDFRIWIPYPNREERAQIVTMTLSGGDSSVKQVLTPDDVVKARSIFREACEAASKNRRVIDEVTRITEKFTTEDWAQKSSPRTDSCITRGAIALSLVDGKFLSSSTPIGAAADMAFGYVHQSAFPALGASVEPAHFTTTDERDNLIRESLRKLEVHAQ
jgi:MoxR-like ATPase